MKAKDVCLLSASGGVQAFAEERFFGGGRDLCSTAFNQMLEICDLGSAFLTSGLQVWGTSPGDLLNFCSPEHPRDFVVVLTFLKQSTLGAKTIQWGKKSVFNKRC